MATTTELRLDLRVLDPDGPPTIDSFQGEGGGDTFYCRACGEVTGHRDSGRMLDGLVDYTPLHVCVPWRGEPGAA